MFLRVQGSHGQLLLSQTPKAVEVLEDGSICEPPMDEPKNLFDVKLAAAMEYNVVLLTKEYSGLTASKGQKRKCQARAGNDGTDKLIINIGGERSAELEPLVSANRVKIPSIFIGLPVKERRETLLAEVWREDGLVLNLQKAFSTEA